MAVKRGTVTIEHRVILALSAMEEARLSDLFLFFKGQGVFLTGNSIRNALTRMCRYGWVAREGRDSGFWWRLLSAGHSVGQFPCGDESASRDIPH